MKRIILSVFVLLMALSAKAQDKASIYYNYYDSTYYSLDCWIYDSLHPFFPTSKTIYMDFDDTDLADMYFVFLHAEGVAQAPFLRLRWPIYYPYHDFDSIWQVNSVSSDEMDTPISELSSNWIYNTTQFGPTNNNPRKINLAVRKKVDDGFCYGWLRFEMKWDTLNPTSKTSVEMYLTIHDFAFCTIPNFPLKFGQTSIIGTDETRMPALTVNPNPTSGTFTVCGTDISRVQVYSINGRSVLDQLANETSTTIDLTNQPAGVYIVDVTDQDGKHCVRKVVKQ